MVSDVITDAKGFDQMYENDHSQLVNIVKDCAEVYGSAKLVDVEVTTVIEYELKDVEI